MDQVKGQNQVTCKEALLKTHVMLKIWFYEDELGPSISIELSEATFIFFLIS